VLQLTPYIGTQVSK